MNLADYFIKQLEEAEPEIENIFEENISKITKEREQDLIADQESKLNQQLEEPTMYETATSVFASLNAYDYFFTVSTKEIVSTDRTTPLPTQAKQELIEKIKENVETELVEIKPDIAKQAVQQKAASIMQQMEEKQKSKLQGINRNAYLNAVCATAFGEAPSLSFDEDVLTFTSYPQSRTQIEILIRNILTWGDDILEKSSGINQDKAKSLIEKAQAISSLLTKYDLDIMNSLTKGHKTTTSIQDFLSNIFNVFNKVKQNAIQATLDFPITEQEAILVRNQQQELHNAEMLQKQFETGLTQEDTQISRESWNAFNENVGTNVVGVTETATSVVKGTINPILNTLGDTAVNIVNVGGLVLNTGIGQLMHSALGILLISCILAIPTLFIIAARAGYISAYFKKRSIIQEPTTTTTPTNTMIKNQTVNINLFLKQQEEGEEYDPYHDYGANISYKTGGKKRRQRSTIKRRLHNKKNTRKYKKSNKFKKMNNSKRRYKKHKKTCKR